MDIIHNKKELQELVEHFRNNIKQYKSQAYDEANTRVDFIDKFFELLDWDISNKQKYSESFREVVREDKVVIAGKPKAPDYSFRIAGRKFFFVEAKKPSVNIKDDVAPAYQVRRYGYTAKLALSILTDFEEFAVYDTRIKPDKNDKASTARIFYCTFEEYDKHYDFIYSIFSKSAILKGSFDKYIEENKKKKGTSEVDKEFLKLISGWREEMARNIALRNKNLDIHQLNYAIQKIIDRIIFLRIAEDRGTEEYGVLLEAALNNNPYEILNQLFLKAQVKYNSGLFKVDTFISGLSIDGSVLKSLITGMYYPDCPYEWSVLPIETLGNIYEQFLGQTIRLTPSHQAKIEEKPEVRKAGGVFYTPQFIVDYIVENTVGEKIKELTPEAIEKLKILDPACGSGSFLIGAYTYLLNYHLNYYIAEKQLKKALKTDKIYELRNQVYHLSIQEKQRILLNNIYGVDIDTQAVEVTKLSLLLKLMENESAESSGLLFRHSDTKYLPNLGENIKCGNSLIGNDFYTDKDLSLFGNEEMRKVNVFDWDKEFSDIFKNGGFDVVIGNPPYIRPENVEKDERNYYLKSNKYEMTFGRFDLYIVFVEKGLSVLKTDGFLSYIIPSSFYNQNYSKLLRKHIISNLSIEKIIDLSAIKVFQDASVQTTILVVSNNKPNRNHQIKVSVPKNLIRGTEFSDYKNILQNIFSTIPQSMIRTNLNQQIIVIINKIKQSSKLLNDICYVVIGAVPHDSKTGASKDRLISSSKINESYKKYIEGKDMGRYVLIDRNIYIDYQPKMMHRPKFPELFENDKIIIRNISTTEGLLAVLDNNNHFYVNDTLSCCLPWYILENVDQRGTKGTIEQLEISKIYNLKFLLGIINSKLLNFYFKNILSSNLHVYPEAIRNLPIYDITKFKDYKMDKVNFLVDQMLDARKSLHNAATDSDKKLFKQKIDLIDKQIDSLVYGLYGLTDEEVRIVEGEKK